MDWQTDGRREGRMNRKPRLKRLCDTKWCVVMIWNQNFLWGYKMLCDFRFHWNEELYPSQDMYWCMSVSLSVCLSVCMANFLLYWKLSVLFSFFSNDFLLLLFDFSSLRNKPLCVLQFPLEALRHYDILSSKFASGRCYASHWVSFHWFKLSYFIFWFNWNKSKNIKNQN